MRGSLRIGKVYDVNVFVHWSLWAMLAIAGTVSLAATRDLPAIALGGAFVVVLFACVFLHELGHAVAARHCGIETRDITLLPIGGVARLERLPSNPVHELWIALAGPVVNLGIFLVVATAGWLCLGLEQIVVGTDLFSKLVRVTLAANLVMFVFNLLPIFPMDGGRVLRAGLSMLVSHAQATRIAALLGQILAVGIGIFGVLVLKNPVMFFLAAYLIVGAHRERAAAVLMDKAAAIPVKQAMTQDFVSISPFESIQRATKILFLTKQRILPIARDGDFFGALTVERVSHLYNTGLKQVPAIEVVDEDIPSVSPGDPLPIALDRLRNSGLHSLPVLEGKWLVGIITRDSINAKMSTHLKRRRTQSRTIKSPQQSTKATQST